MIRINNIRQELPPGLEDCSIEIYAHGVKLRVIYNGAPIDFWDLPKWIIEKFRHDLFSKKNLINHYVGIGIIDEDEMLFHYVWCFFGGWNRDPDFSSDGFHPEYWDCGNRGKCKLEGVACIKLNDEEKNLSVQELKIVKLIAEGYADKQIADKLDISYHTATTHRQNIEKKLGAASKVEVAAFAIKMNLPGSHVEALL